MPTFVVTGPDGKRYRVTAPKGATQAEVLRRVQAQRKPDNSRVRGFLGGILKPIDNAATWLDKALPWVDDFGQAIGFQSTEKTVAKNEDARRNNTRKGYQIAGNIAGTAPTLLLPGGVVAQGAAAGALLSDDPNNARGVARDAVIGGAASKAGEQLGKRILAPAAERLGRTAPARKVAETVARVTGRRPLPAPRLTATDKVVNKTKVPLDVARQNLDDAQRLGLPYGLADADPRLRTLGGTVVRKSADARALAEQNMGGRATDQGYRAIKGIEDHLARPIDVKQVGQGIIQTARNRSGPLYEKSFQGGSMAPLESQLADALNTTSRSVAAAKSELAMARRTATQSAAAVHRAGDNVYMNANALPVNRQADAAIAAAQQKVVAAEAAHSQTLEMLRRAQGDASVNAPGAVWSPRVQQFLDDPIAKDGLSRGLEIQRLESLAQGKPFNPTEYAITGLDEAGRPVVGNVPNMRTLDAVKKGLDGIIDDYPKDFRGNPILDERGRAVTRVLKSFRNEVDGLNPDYQAARGTYERYAKAKTALDRGFSSTGKTVPNRDLGKVVEGMGPREQAMARAGYATSLRDQVANATDSTDAFRLIHGGPERRAKIETMFPDGSRDFGRMAELEGQMAATARETLGGSPTALRAAQDELFDSNAAADMALDVVAGGGTPSPMGAVRTGAGLFKKLSAPRISEKKAAAIAPDLLGTDPQQALRYLDELMRRNADMATRKEAYRRAGGLFSLPATAGSLSLLP
jgi:hypothetical protein